MAVEQRELIQPDDEPNPRRFEQLLANPRIVGRAEMEAIMDQYEPEEVLLMASCITHFQISAGCSPQCDFCCMNTPKGPTAHVSPEGAEAFLTKKTTWPTSQNERQMTVGAVVRNPWLVRGGVAKPQGPALYWKSEGLDSPWYEEILRLAKEHSLHRPSLTTAFPDVEGVGDRIIELIRKGYDVRISVTKENIARLVEEDFLMKKDPSGVSRIIEKLRALVGSNRVGQGQYISVVRSEGLRYESRIPGQKIEVGKNGEGTGRDDKVTTGRLAEIGKSFSKTNTGVISFEAGVLLDPKGFYNIVNIPGYEHLKKSRTQILKVKIDPNFRESTYIEDLIEGKVPIEHADLRKILQNGVVEKGEVREEPSSTVAKGFRHICCPPVITVIPDIMQFRENDDGSVTESIRKVDVHTLIQDGELIISKLVGRTEMTTRTTNFQVFTHDTEDQDVIVRNPQARRCIEDDLKKDEEGPFEPVNVQQKIARLIRAI